MKTKIRFFLSLFLLCLSSSIQAEEDVNLLNLWRQNGVHLITKDFSHPKLQPYEKFAKSLENNAKSITGIPGLDHTGLIFGEQEIKMVQEAADSLAKHHGVVVFEYSPYRFGPKGEEFDSLVDLHIRGDFPREFEEEVGKVILSQTLLLR